MDIKKQLGIIKRGVVEIISEKELIAKLEKKKPLLIKAGFDPTAPDIHLGHTVLLRKLMHFQELGHKVIFLIGDATARVGDPSGQSQTRKTLTADEIGKNARTYEKQIGKILNTKNPNLYQLRYNSEWFSTHGPREKSSSPFAFEQFVELAQRYTVARLLERDDFEKRLKENKPISFLELFYPLMQGYDSVQLNSDIEIGGTDQKFNMLVGRDLQQAYNKERQVVITTPLLIGLDGVNKMSKSLGNHIGIDDKPEEMFGKIMSISDELMIQYYELLTDENLDEIHKLHPMEAKKKLAKDMVRQYHEENLAETALKDFENKFQKRDPFTELKLEAKALKSNLCDFLVTEKICVSNGEYRRLIEQGAIEVNGDRLKDLVFPIESSKEYRIKVGKKRFVKAVFRP
ncbi:MAG: tyrosine--tRNA ligase [Candidatus Omnitrophica bacterium CG1_02_40_15]|nr:MAG: tyrosine--tRNA ligase [Candidatus Omnitrophica bacterium CG1_02_40_15]